MAARGRALGIAVGLLTLADAADAGEKDAASFWERQRGANCQNRKLGPGYWQAAAGAGLQPAERAAS